MCVLIEIDWIRTNEYFIIFPSLHTSQSLWSNLPDSSSSPFFAFPPCRVCSSVHSSRHFQTRCLYHTHTHTHQSINQSKMPRPTNDKITLISAIPEQERFEVSTDVAKCVLLYVITVFFNFFAFEKNARDRASRNRRLSFSPSRFKRFPALIARNRPERNSYETYWPILSLLLRPNSMSQTVKTAISGTHCKRFFRLLFLLLLFSFRFFWKSHVKLAGEFSTHHTTTKKKKNNDWLMSHLLFLFNDNTNHHKQTARRKSRYRTWPNRFYRKSSRIANTTPTRRAKTVKTNPRTIKRTSIWSTWKSIKRRCLSSSWRRTTWTSRICSICAAKPSRIWSKGRRRRKFARRSTSRTILRRRKRKKFARKTNGRLNKYSLKRLRA